jgi:pilus assembly protein CpaB
MERLKNKTLLLRIALLSGIAIAMLGLLWPKNVSIHLPGVDNSDGIPVLVADHYIPAFSAIKPEMVRVENYPKSLVPPGALHAKGELQNESMQMLFAAAVAIPEGQPVTRALVIGAEQSESLTTQISPGKVAVSFEMDKAHGVGGWIKPGDTIALFHTVLPSVNGARPQGRMTQILLPAVPVLAVDEKRLAPPAAEATPDASMNGVVLSPTEARVITVLVTPGEATEIIEAREGGALSAVLRAVGDDYPWPTTH